MSLVNKEYNNLETDMCFSLFFKLWNQVLMLQMDSPAQIDGRSSKPLLKCSKIALQTIFGDEFYTIPTEKTLPRQPELLELPSILKIKSKSTRTFRPNCKISTVATKIPPSVGGQTWLFLNTRCFQTSPLLLYLCTSVLKCTVHLRVNCPKHVT